MSAGRLWWVHCGHDLLASDETSRGQLKVTDDFLRLFLQAPELAPIEQSCAAELALHQSLMQSPQRQVTEADLASLKDPDAADNYRVWLRFRARMLARPTLEGCYMALFEGQGVDVPPSFVHQLTQVLLRHIIGDQATPFLVRSAEMMFKSQKISLLEDGSVMAADEETVERYATTGGFGSLGALLRQGDLPTRSIDLNVLNEGDDEAFWNSERDNAERFAPHQTRHEWVLKLNHNAPALDALCKLIELWVHHFLGVEVRVQVEKSIDDQQWVWHVGLDAQASSILNDLYTGAEVEEARLKRLLCLFSLRFVNADDMAAEVRGHPVYLAMAMDEQQRLRLKPQNLLLNLPLARRS